MPPHYRVSKTPGPGTRVAFPASPLSFLMARHKSVNPKVYTKSLAGENSIKLLNINFRSPEQPCLRMYVCARNFPTIYHLFVWRQLCFDDKAPDAFPTTPTPSLSINISSSNCLARVASCSWLLTPGRILMNLRTHIPFAFVAAAAVCVA